LADFGLPVPRVATLGSLAFNVLLMLLTLGLGLFAEVPDRVSAIGQAVVLGLFAAVAYLLVFGEFHERLGVLLTASTALSLCLAAGGWFFVKKTQAARAGLERFASLGRFSAQMAHDLRNPLAAARGAAEYLAEELRRADQPQHQEFANLIVAQLDRLGTVIARYQRLSKLQPELGPVDLNQLVARVLSLQGYGTTNVAFEQALAQAPMKLQADADLLASALENLVKNGVEAMPAGGPLTVSTRLEEGDVPCAVLSVRDGGTGMDARAREQAFEMFFTTKATGSGLGLAFVQQVARAHGGLVRLESREGAGTLVEVVLPLVSPEALG
jgi:signal transduction histidine kinase